MKISSILKNYPDVFIATNEDNEDLLSFFQNTPMEGKGLILNYLRSPNFFTFLHCQSNEHLVFILKINGTIEGVATIVIKSCYIHGKITRIGYLGDLRVIKSKNNSVLWRSLYNEIINNSKEIEEIKTEYFLTAVIDSNAKAQKALVKKRENSFIYHHLTAYKMVNIYFRKPWHTKNRNYVIRRATPQDQSLLLNFWLKHESLKPFGQPELVDHALKNWKNFSIEDFVLVFSQDQLVGMCGLWSPSYCKKITIEKFPLILKIISILLRLRRKSFPLEGQELRPLYLTHLNFEQPSILKDLLDYIYELPITQKFHILSYCHFPFYDQYKIDDAFICQKMDMSLFQVIDGRHPEIKITDKNHPPGFEMSLV